LATALTRTFLVYLVKTMNKSMINKLIATWQQKGQRGNAKTLWGSPMKQTREKMLAV